MCEQPQQQESGDHGQLGEQHTAPSDASSTTTGPTRVEAPAGAVASLPAGVALSQLLGPSNMTLLHLPLKPGSEDVGQKLAQLRPTLLLFLRQLRCLVLSDAEAGTVSKEPPQTCGIIEGAAGPGVVARSSSSQLLRLSATGCDFDIWRDVLSGSRSSLAADWSSQRQVAVECCHKVMFLCAV
jgi:hypothetical protein